MTERDSVVLGFSEAGSAFLAEVGRRGGNPEALKSYFQVPEGVGPRVGQLRAGLEACGHAAQDPLLGIHVAQAVWAARPFAGGAALPLPALRAGLEPALIQRGTLKDLGRYQVHETDDSVRVTFEVPLESEALGPQGNLFVVTDLLLQIRRLLGDSAAPRTVWLAHQMGEIPAELIQLLGTGNVCSGSGFNGLLWDARLMPARPLAPLSHPSPEALVEQVRSVLHATLSSGAMPVERMALRLTLSSRTLQRRLMSIGTSYSLVLEQVRRELAAHYLRMPLTVEKVALLLGYSDLTAFIRAHRRWTGVSPGRSRREGLPQSVGAPPRELAYG